MKILIVTENFKTGGLETQIMGFCRHLRNSGHEIYLISGIGSRTSPLREIMGDHILEVDMRPNISTKEAIKSINTIVSYAKEIRADILHLHPFTSFIYGGIAASLVSKPYVVTLHGPLSLTYGYSATYRLFLEIILKDAWKVFCVSKELSERLKSTILTCNCVILPNAIDVDRFRPATYTSDGAIALVSRIDGDKLPGIKHFLKLWAFLPDELRKPVRIFGEGNASHELEIWVDEELGRPDWIIIKGHEDNLQRAVASGYSAIVGMGRVVLEALSMELPAILIGYDGTKGVVRFDNIEDLAYRNFSGRYLPNIEELRNDNDVKASTGEQGKGKNIPNSANMRKIGPPIGERYFPTEERLRAYLERGGAEQSVMHMKQILSVVPEITEQDVICDIGCANGAGSKYLSENVKGTVLAFDLWNWPSELLEYNVHTGLDLYDPSTWDIFPEGKTFLLSHAIEHLEEPWAALDALIEIKKPAMVVINVPYDEVIPEDAKPPQHLHSFSGSELRQWAVKSNAKNLRISRVPIPGTNNHNLVAVFFFDRYKLAKTAMRLARDLRIVGRETERVSLRKWIEENANENKILRQYTGEIKNHRAREYGWKEAFLSSIGEANDLSLFGDKVFHCLLNNFPQNQSIYHWVNLYLSDKINRTIAEKANIWDQLSQAISERDKELQPKIQRLGTLNDALSAKLEQSKKRINDMLSNGRYAISLIHDLNSSKSMRMAKFMRFTKDRFVNGSFSSRMRYLKQILNKMLRKKPLDTSNLLKQVEYEIQSLSNMAEEQIYAIDTYLQNPAGSIAQASPRSLSCNTFAGLFTKRKGLKTIRILTPLFNDAEGKKFLYGGAERYHLEIGRIAHELGFNAEIWQIANHDWELEHYIESGTIRVIGVGCPTIHDYFELNKRFHERATDPVAMVIYSPFVVAYPECVPNSIGISHGIFWDNSFYQEPQVNAEKWNKTIIAAISNCHKIVSVDTNTINWLRAVNYSLSDRLFYIPNFVDTKKFKPERNADDSRLKVIFPRRICQERGSRMALALANHLMEKYEWVDFDFIGTGDPKEEALVRKLKKEYPNRIKAYSLASDEMHKAYANADICIIPTLNSEGTSLSCLEAMASANAVVATNVGGLTDLILNKYNGILISPSLDELIDAVDMLIENDSLRKTVGQNAREVSKTFDLERWREKWKTIIKETCGIAKSVEAKNPRKRFVHLCHPNITWSYMQQRPQHLFKALGQETDWELLFISDEDIKPFNAGHGVRVLPYNSDVQLDENTWVYIYNPNMINHRNNYEMLSQAAGYHFLFDVLDDPMIHADFDTKTLSESFRMNYEALLSGADIVITSAESIREKIEPSRSDIHIVPNGVFLEDFEAKADSIRPKDLPDNKKILGFFGALYEWRADYELIGKMADSFPDCAVVIIGVVTPREAMEVQLRTHSNIILLPAKPHKELKNYIKCFNVAFIPFLVNEVTNGMSTIKLFEYCAARKPIVSTAFREIKKYNVNGVCIANNHEEFLSAIGKYLENPPGESHIETLYQIAKEGTWSARAKSIITLVNSHPTRRSDCAGCSPSRLRY